MLIPRLAILNKTLAWLKVKTRDDYLLFNPNNLFLFLNGKHYIKATRKALNSLNK
jgi:hypothetical protein